MNQSIMFGFSLETLSERVFAF